MVQQQTLQSQSAGTWEHSRNAEIVRLYLYSTCSLRCTGLRSLCDKVHDVILLGSERELSKNYETVLALQPHIIVIDADLLVSECSQRLAETFKPILQSARIIVIASHLNVPFACSAIVSGASGYLITSASAESFFQAFRVVIAGGLWLGLELTHLLLENSSRLQNSDPSTITRLLSSREQQILNFVAKGKTSKEIARELYLSESSVHTYWHRIMSKLNVLNKSEAIARASHLGLIKYALEEDEVAHLAASPQLKELVLKRLQEGSQVTG